ncbi:MAG TPA: diacylglycerol kinase family protein [Actinomycetota bacterium]|nr:diacylglycerol kinase family protein [Actinomycetota bacterium]
MRAYVISNPKAGRGSDGARLAAALRHAGLDAEVAVTEGPAHGVDLARSARDRGEPLVVAAGGDGTVHEVVNGLLAPGGPSDPPILGVLPLGSGCDYVKTFGIPHDLAKACAVIADPRPAVAVDAAEVTYTTPEGSRTRYLANIAEVGIGPEVVDRAARLPRALGPALYLVAFWLVLPRYERRRATVRIGAAAFDGRLTNLVVANARVFGGGMRVAPAADPADGLLDVQVHTASKPDYVRNIGKVFKGTHLPHPRIAEFRGPVVEVTCDPPALIEADGEVLGTTPATFRVLPGALRLKVGGTGLD